MKRLTVFMVLAALSLASLYAVPLTATWIEGDVALRQGTTWQEILAGDSLDSSSVVRLGRGSLAEFSSGSQKIALSTEGTFNLGTLIKAGGAQEEKRSNVVSKMGKLIDKQAPRSTVVAGVRGDFEGKPETTLWAVDEEDPEALAAEARALLAEENYTQAADLFGRAAVEAFGDQRDEFLYTQAWCLAAGDSVIGAIKVLRPMGSSGPYALPRAILLARLSIDTGASAEAALLLDEAARNPALSGEDAELVRQMRLEIK